jgi:hypothetical protein
MNVLSRLRPGLLAAVIGLASAGNPDMATAQTALNYVTSWIGNTFGYGDGKWVQQDVQALAVTPDGTTFTNAPWDESGGEMSSYKNGDMLGVAGETHGWGNAGGDAIALNSTYLYAAVSIGNEGGGLSGSGYPPNGSTWFGITRRFVSNFMLGAPMPRGAANSNNPAQNSFALLTTAPAGTDAAIRGLAATETELYVSNTYGNQIVVLDAVTMSPLRSWSVQSPGKLAVDTDGTLWVIQGIGSAAGPTVVHYTARGGLLSSGVPLPASTVPVDIAISPTGQLLIADNGPSQQILVFTKAANGQPVLTGGVGTRNGIYHATAGVPGRLRFNGITSIAFDRAGNLYVAQNGSGPRATGTALVGQGAVIESYNYANLTVNWTLQGLLFVDSGTFDPSNPSVVYSGSKRFTLDYTRPTGQEWSYAGFTLNRFKYPDDPSLHVNRAVRGEPMVRIVNGQRLLYTLDQQAHYLIVYRFNAATDGETAIPAGLITQVPFTGAWPVGQPTYGEWMWRDADGDGVVEANEIQGNPSTGNTVANGYWWVDENGAVWLGSLVSGIRKMPLQGFDAQGNPVYSYASAIQYPMPAPFTRIGRVNYFAATDTMYITGYTTDYPKDPTDNTHWKEAGRVLMRYDNWSSGTPTRTWGHALPWVTNTTPQQTTVSIAVAGDYVFVAELYTAKIDIFDNRTGVYVGALTPGATVGNTSGWVDVYMGISAVKRGNGEYVVLVEDDARAKFLMYRWTP